MFEGFFPGWPGLPPGVLVSNYEILPKHGVMFLLLASIGSMLVCLHGAQPDMASARLSEDCNSPSAHDSEGAGFSLAWSGARSFQAL
jgi:hypothetical protein